jgi:uncharacterized protein (DUF433 family)
MMGSDAADRNRSVATSGRRRGPTMQDHPRIALDPARLSGKPVICGTRLAVEFIVGLLAEGWSEADILANYPAITRDDILACLAYARAALQSERVFPSAAEASYRKNTRLSTANSGSSNAPARSM